jgi:G3E family GTPase
LTGQPNLNNRLNLLDTHSESTFLEESMDLLIQWEMLARHKEVVRAAERRAQWEQDGGVIPQKESPWLNWWRAAQKRTAHILNLSLRPNREKIVHELLR